MKTLFFTALLFLSTQLLGQEIKFSKKTTALYENILDAELKKGLNEKEAIKAVLNNGEYKQLLYKDLEDANKKASKAGVSFSKNIGIIATHKTVAILPFSTDIEVKKSKNTSKKEILKDEAELTDDVQVALYKYLMKNQFDYSVDFQEITKTNQILKNKGLLQVMSSTPNEQLAEALGVDAVITGAFSKEMKGSKLKSVMTRTLTSGLVGAATGEAAIRMMITDGESGDVIWRIDTEEDGKFSDSNGMIKDIMDKVIDFFPYKNSFISKKKKK